MGGISEVSLFIIDVILFIFEDIFLEWLLCGKGIMLFLDVEYEWNIIFDINMEWMN